MKMPDKTSLQPDDLTVEPFRPIPAEFHFVDEDPSDPAAGRDEVVVLPSGHNGHA
jgi:hypothetical protein